MGALSKVGFVLGIMVAVGPLFLQASEKDGEDLSRLSRLNSTKDSSKPGKKIPTRTYEDAAKKITRLEAMIDELAKEMKDNQLNQGLKEERSLQSDSEYREEQDDKKKERAERRAWKEAMQSSTYTKKNANKTKTSGINKDISNATEEINQVLDMARSNHSAEHGKEEQKNAMLVKMENFYKHNIEPIDDEICTKKIDINNTRYKINNIIFKIESSEESHPTINASGQINYSQELKKQEKSLAYAKNALIELLDKKKNLIEGFKSQCMECELDQVRMGSKYEKLGTVENPLNSETVYDRATIKEKFGIEENDDITNVVKRDIRVLKNAIDECYIDNSKEYFPSSQSKKTVFQKGQNSSREEQKQSENSAKKRKRTLETLKNTKNITKTQLSQASKEEDQFIGGTWTSSILNTSKTPTIIEGHIKYPNEKVVTFEECDVGAHEEDTLSALRWGHEENKSVDTKFEVVPRTQDDSDPKKEGKFQKFFMKFTSNKKREKQGPKIRNKTLYADLRPDLGLGDLDPPQTGQKCPGESKVNSQITGVEPRIDIKKAGHKKNAASTSEIASHKISAHKKETTTEDSSGTKKKKGCLVF